MYQPGIGWFSYWEVHRNGVTLGTFRLCVEGIKQFLRVALHFCDVTLSAKKPLSEAYPKTLQILGDHRRKRRLDLKLFQKDAAKAIGVDTLTICNWEKNRTNPRRYLLPKINHFLCYNPLRSHATSLGEKIKQCRIQKGLSFGRLAKELGVDPGTLSRREKGRSKPKNCIQASDG
jgi:transcriptional regulator with XRE-family HTH domain